MNDYSKIGLKTDSYEFIGVNSIKSWTRPQKVIISIN